MHRKKIIVIFLLLATFVIILRFAFLMLNAPIHQESNIQPPQITRGNITDRDGNLLAIETEFFSLAIWKPDLEEPSLVAHSLAPLLGQSEQELHTILTRSREGEYFFLKRKLSGSLVKKFHEINDKTPLKGVLLESEYGRVYPLNDSAAQLIGYVNIDNHGQDGIEYTYDRVLSPLNWNQDNSLIYGNNVALTIDSNAQFILEKNMRIPLEEHNPDTIMGLLIEAKTGEILSYAQLPSYDLNQVGNYTEQQRRNQIATTLYEPGSVFKVFTMASILAQNSRLTERTRVDTSHSYNPESFQKFSIPPITDLNNYGILTIPEILIYSSNVGMAFLSEKITRKQLYKSLEKLGFNHKTSLPFQGQPQGQLQDYQKWSLRSKPTISFGQEVGVTTLQMVQAATAIANEGNLLNLHIIKQITSPEGNIIEEATPEILHQALPKSVTKSILSSMRQVVENPSGTARRLKIPGLAISAKSGTAQIYDPKTGLYSTKSFLGSLLSIFPADDPEFILYLVMINPKDGKTYGGATLSPIMRNIILDLIPYYGIENSISSKFSVSNNIKLNPARTHSDSFIVDLDGYSKREVLDYAKSINMKITIIGEGWVIYQFPPPTTPINSTETLYVELRSHKNLSSIPTPTQ